MNLPNEGAAPAPGSGLPNFGRVAKPTGPAKPITMAGIAKAAGVSQGAISSLLNDRDYGIRVSEKTRDRVFKVCRELGYVPNDLRAVVRMYPEKGDTCLLLSSKTPGGLGNSFVARIAGVLLGLAKQGSVAIAHYDETHEYAADGEDLPPPIKNGTASKYLCVGAANPGLCQVLQRRGHPVAIIGHETRLPGATSVLPDYLGAARLAFSQFVKHGHKTIGIVGGPFGSPEPRLADLNRALGLAAQELGLNIEAQNIFQGDLTFESGVAGMDALHNRPSPPTAIFALSETTACGVFARAHSLGISIPEKLSLLAISDHAAKPPCCAPLTTVVVPVEDLATTAAQEVDRQIQAGLPSSGHRIMLGVKLYERESLASPA